MAKTGRGLSTIRNAWLDIAKKSSNPSSLANNRILIYGNSELLETLGVKIKDNPTHTYQTNQCIMYTDLESTSGPTPPEPVIMPKTYLYYFNNDLIHTSTCPIKAYIETGEQIDFSTASTKRYYYFDEGTQEIEHYDEELSEGDSDESAMQYGYFNDEIQHSISRLIFEDNGTTELLSDVIIPNSVTILEGGNYNYDNLKKLIIRTDEVKLLQLGASGGDFFIGDFSQYTDYEMHTVSFGDNTTIDFLPSISGEIGWDDITRPQPVEPISAGDAHVPFYLCNKLKYFSCGNLMFRDSATYGNISSFFYEIKTPDIGFKHYNLSNVSRFPILLNGEEIVQDFLLNFDFDPGNNFRYNIKKYIEESLEEHLYRTHEIGNLQNTLLFTLTTSGNPANVFDSETFRYVDTGEVCGFNPYISSINDTAYDEIYVIGHYLDYDENDGYVRKNIYAIVLDADETNPVIFDKPILTEDIDHIYFPSCVVENSEENSILIPRANYVFSRMTTLRPNFIGVTTDGYGCCADFTKLETITTDTQQGRQVFSEPTIGYLILPETLTDISAGICPSNATGTEMKNIIFLNENINYPQFTYVEELDNTTRFHFMNDRFNRASLVCPQFKCTTIDITV